MNRVIEEVPVHTGESNAARLAHALGIEQEPLQRIPNAKEEDDQDAAAMQESLWHVLFGYYYDQFLSGPGDRERLREEFAQRVRCRGTLPTLRIGDQPYGFQPVVYDGFFGEFQVNSTLNPLSDPFEDRLELTCRHLRGDWLSALGQVPRLTPGTADAGEELVRILAMTSVPYRFAIRAAAPREFFEGMADLLALETGYSGVAGDFVHQEATDEWNAMGLSGTSTKLTDVVHADGSAEWQAPLVQEAQVSWDAGLEEDYISWILSAELQELRDLDHDFEFTRPPLLFLLLRHAAMRVMTHFVRDTTVSSGAGGVHTEPFAHASSAGNTVWDEYEALRDSGLALDLEKMASGSLTAGGHTITTEREEEAKRLRVALQHLSGLSSAVLERIFVETLAACSYRLDAWEEVLVRVRLEAWRLIHPEESWVGAYGWLEDVRPSAEEQSRLGYQLAPSQGHASTMAVLRSGWDAHSGTAEDPLGTLAVNLSSAAVRRAKWLLDGIRKGFSLESLLGARCERLLHDAEEDLDVYIARLRETYPARDGKVDHGGSLGSSASSREVVDGLALVQAWRDYEDGGAVNPIESIDGSADSAALEEVFGDLSAELDAAADALTAESVHQLVQGNISGMGASVEAASSGDAPVPQLEFARTPHAGTSLTHRLLLMLPSGWDPGDDDWPEASRSRRARAEPELEAWAASRLGDPALYRAKAVFRELEENGEAVLLERTFRLKDVLRVQGLGALDLLALAPADDTARAGELDLRIAVAVEGSLSAAERSDLDGGYRIELDYAPEDLVSAAELVFRDAFELARSLRSLLYRGEALEAADLTLPTDEFEETLDGDELLTRAADLVTAFQEEARALGEQMDALADEELPTGEKPSARQVREVLHNLADLGVPGAFAPATYGDASAAAASLLTLAQTVRTRADDLSTSLDALATDFDSGSATDEEKVSYARKRIRKLLGRRFPVLPHFQPGNAPELEATFARSTALQKDDPGAVTEWLPQVALVRAGAGRLERACILNTALRDDAHLADLDLQVGQLPHDDSTWCALEGESDGQGKVSLVAHLPGGTGVSGSVLGLRLDQWVEDLPVREETAGLAFHFDAPAARPPHVVLICCPRDGQAWYDDQLLGGIVEAYQRMRYRLVDTQRIGGFGQHLPATYVPTEESSAVVGTDLLAGTEEIS